MRVIVFSEDKSGRRDHGYYSKPDLASALDVFFSPSGSKMFLDMDGNDEMTREDAMAAFEVDRQVTFYNDDGERAVITADPSP